MSDILTGYRTYLLDKSGVTFLVAARIYREYLPQSSALPAVVLREISRESEQYLKGGAGLAMTRIQVDAYATTAVQAEAVREAIRCATKPSTAATWGSETVTDLGHESFHARMESPMDGSDNWRFVSAFDVVVSHTEAEPS